MQHIRLTNDTGYERQFAYDGRRMRRFSVLTPSVISITGRLVPERRRVEQFIERVFADHYQAQIVQHYPTLMSVRNHEDVILGALGFRFAASEALFLEQYLDQPVEDAASGLLDQPVARQGIVEVGSLASHGQGASIFLITALIAYLKQLGYCHVVFTATAELHQYFVAIGLEPQVIADADQSRLCDGGASWGSYYDTQPRLIVGDIDHANTRLHRFLGVQLQSVDEALFARLHPKGE